ncbi:MAG TPA: MMPL family transporter, partial [Acidimicrobiia bacterium]|nr:MMPL family transporter [Acidimicrobiia bacterium]
MAAWIVRRRVPVLIGTVVVMALAGFFGGGVASRLSSGGFEDRDAESYRAGLALSEQFGVEAPDIVIVATNPEGSVDTPQAMAAGVALT